MALLEYFRAVAKCGMRSAVFGGVDWRKRFHSSLAFAWVMSPFDMSAADFCTSRPLVAGLVRLAGL
ncbi:MAG: hypothetical protein DMG04_26675 [Acidobacteria bacterium]|nr:MAG: hypothetical protein DMG04_26675 [Acidobacteriota bacterium]